ncbi:MAG: 16S rRNA (adenine(1518)-N(6)/adenine(1519)-N(6))-dimethyltransferase RsmA [Candidatus Omnitrophota bacterium]|jgi:16S rRNA (adenine1518-N6/adenine1519-N6)-dimethyltransferase
MLTQIELLKKYGLRIRGHLGQHLLMDPNTIRKIVDALNLQPGEHVFEIGPGLGAVTQEVLRRGFPLLAVETDKKFVEILTGELLPEHPRHFRLVHGDILKSDPAKMIREWAGPGAKVKVIGNLPYYISTPILFHLIEHAEVFSNAVLMLQKEVAARLTAQAGDEDYGRLSVTSRFYGETEFLFDVSPKCFLPPPEVTSRVVRYTFRSNFLFLFHQGSLDGPNFRSAAIDQNWDRDNPKPCREKFLLEIIRVAFSQRRKTLLSLLVHHLKPKQGREDLERLFEKLGFSSKVRGETLSLEQFILLSKALASSKA